MRSLAPINPLDTTAMHFFDLGDVESPDGRAHPVTAMTPVSLNTQPASAPVDATPVSNTSFGGQLLSSLLPSAPPHFGARLVVSVLGIGILLIVAFRLAK